MKKVLIFPCGSEIGLELFRALQYEKNIQLWGGTSVDSNHGRFLFEHYITGIPYVTDSDFIPALNRLLEANGIDYIFPAMDSVLLELSKHRDRLCAELIGSPHETNVNCVSKLKSYHLFKDKILVPQIHDPADIADDLFPVFLKPEAGYGSRGTCLVRDAKSLDFHLAQDPSLMVLEYLPGKEYTVDCFTDRHGRLRFTGCRERMRIQSGIAVHSRPVESSRFKPIAEVINRHLTFRGVWFFQVKENAVGDLALLEIATRTAGTMALFRNKGVNLPMLSIYDAMGMDVEIIENNPDIEIDRALTNRFRLDYEYDYVYVDFDDCLVLRGRVNSVLVMYLYQCIDRGKKIILITKHAGDLTARLKDFRLHTLFDEIIHLEQAQRKAEFMTHQPAVFIDDAFSERLDVSRKLGIPVFEPGTVECLLDWRY